MLADEIEHQLASFTGSTCYYEHSIGNFKYTEGVNFLAEECQSYWLLDVIGSYQSSFRDLAFQSWKLIVSKDKSGLVTMVEDIGQPEKVHQEIEHTDFPLKKIELYMTNNVLLLPGEY